MAAADFPSSPTVGQTYSNNGRTWTYTSAGIWDTTNTGTIAGDITVTGNSTIQGNETVNGSFTAANYSMAGKNVIINGGFDFWQRGNGPTAAGLNNITFLADRWFTYRTGSGSTATVERVPFTPGTSPSDLAETAYYFRYNQTVAGTGMTSCNIGQRIEDVRTLAGQTVTLSFWAKADSTARTITPVIYRGFGTGGTASDGPYAGSVITLGLNWAKYSQVITLPTITGKTIGDGSYIELSLALANNTVQTIDIWGVQLERGSVATPFSRAGGTRQGELVNCMYYYAYFPNLWGTVGADGYWATVGIPHAAYMRATPVAIVDVVNTPASGGNIGTNISLNMASKTMGYFHPSSPPGSNTWLNFAGVKLDAEL